MDINELSDEELIALYLAAPNPENLTETEQAALDEIDRRGLDI